MTDKRHSAMLTVIVPMVIGEIVRAYGIRFSSRFTMKR